MLAGAALRLWQYLANSSLWIDEAALARNIIERPIPDLLGSLHYAQVAPVGFLLIEKAITELFGASEYALRLFPLIAGLAALFLFWAVARRLLAGWSVPFATGLFSLGIPFIYFSSQVKQYSSDIAAALLLLLVALELRSRGIDRLRVLWLASTGAVAVWISQTAMFVMAGIGSAFVILMVLERNPHGRRMLLAGVSTWLVSGLAVAVHSLSSVSDLDREYFRAFWSAGFMPFPPASLQDVSWLPDKMVWVFGAFGPGVGHTNGGLNYRWSPVFAAVVIYGYWTLWRTRRDVVLLLLLPVLAAVGASAAGLYPFTARLLAFLIPFLLLALAAGTDHLLRNLPTRLQFLGPLALAILGGAPLYAIATARPPSWVQHLRPGLEYLGQHRREGDPIYVYYGANLAFRYYAPRLGISGEGVIFGGCGVNDHGMYLRELDRLRGQRRVWVVITHEQLRGERELVLSYLNRLGPQLDVIDIPATSRRPIERASVHLYDLSAPDPDVNAVTHPLPATLAAPSGGLMKWGCYGITGGEPRAPGTL